MSHTYLNSRQFKTKVNRPTAQRTSGSRIQTKLAFGVNLDFLKQNVIWQIAGFVVLTVSLFYLVQIINSNSSIQSQAAADSNRIITNFNLQANLKTQSKVEIADAK